jgi:hypothetical protein
VSNPAQDTGPLSTAPAQNASEQENSKKNGFERVVQPVAQKQADEDDDEFEAPVVSYVDKDGDIVKFTCEEGYLIMYVNDKKCAGEADTTGIVTRLTYGAGRPADIRTQHGFGNADFPWYVVMKLKEMCVGIGVPNNLPEEPETCYGDKDGDKVQFGILENHLIMCVNGYRSAGKGDNTGVVTTLFYRTGQPADVRTQWGFGNNDFPWLLVMMLKKMADSINLPNNLPEAPARTPQHSHNLRLARRNKECDICGDSDTMFSCCLDCDFDICLRCFEDQASANQAVCTPADDAMALEALFARHGVPDVKVSQVPEKEDMDALTQALMKATNRCVSVLQEKQEQMLFQ